MHRRDAIARLIAITGTMAVGGELFLSGCKSPDAQRRTSAMSAADIALLDEIGDTIIPATDTPGAKAVHIGAFMAMMSHDIYDDATYAAFREGLASIDALSQKRLGRSFVEMPPSERTGLLNELDREQREYSRTRKPNQPVHYFRLIKELTLLGFFSSETGCTVALRYVESPGSFDGNVSYRKGDKAWYNPSRRIS